MLIQSDMEFIDKPSIIQTTARTTATTVVFSLCTQRRDTCDTYVVAPLEGNH